MNEPKNIFSASVLLIFLVQTGLAWSNSLSEKAFKSPSNIPPEYQAAISKTYPGYQILNPSEVFLDRGVMGPELYDKVKESPGLIVGNFNNDSIDDFVVLVRNSVTKKDSWSPKGKFVDKNNNEKYDVYDVNLAVVMDWAEVTSTAH